MSVISSMHVACLVPGIKITSHSRSGVSMKERAANLSSSFLFVCLFVSSFFRSFFFLSCFFSSSFFSLSFFFKPMHFFYLLDK